jgi:hypothetical protein
MPDDWIKRGVELPDGLHKSMAQRARQIAGDRRGLARYVWTFAVIAALEQDDETLHRAASRLRGYFEEDPAGFAAAIARGDYPPMQDLLRPPKGRKK